MSDILADVIKVWLDTRAEFSGDALKVKQIGVCRNTDDPTKGVELIGRAPDGTYVTIEKGVLQSDWAEIDTSSEAYIKNKLPIISAQITAPTLAELQALVDDGVTVFYAGSNGGLTTLPTGTLNLNTQNYTFVGNVKDDGVGFKLSGDLNLNYSEFSGVHIVNLTCLVNLNGHKLTSNASRVEIEKLSNFSFGAEVDTTSATYVESLILSSSDLKCPSSPIKYQYLSSIGGKLLDSSDNDITESSQEDWVRPQPTDLDVKTIKIDSQGKVYDDRIFQVVDKSTGTVLGSIRGNGDILWGENATIASILTGVIDIVDRASIANQLDIGSPSDVTGVINTKAQATGVVGYELSVPAGSDTVGLYTASTSSSVDYPTDPVYEFSSATETYYLFSGQVSSKKYWFVGKVIYTGTTAYTDCQFRHLNGSGASQTEEDAWVPTDDVFTGVNAPDTGLPASISYQSGVLRPAINSDGEVRAINLPAGLPAGATKAGNLAITTEGIYYIE